MSVRKLKAIENEIVVTDSRISEKHPAYCFIHFSAAYSYLEKFCALEKPLRTYVHFYKTLFERRHYAYTREDGHNLRFQLVKKLSEADIEAL